MFKGLGDKIADIAKESSSAIKDAGKNFVEVVMPRIIASTKKMMAKGGAGVEKVIAGIVATLKKFGSDALMFAIDWIEPRRKEVEDILMGKLLSELKKALKEMELQAALKF